MTKPLKMHAKPGIDSGMQAMAKYCECAALTPAHLLTFLFVASRGPILLSQLSEQSTFLNGNAEEIVSSLLLRDQSDQRPAVLTIFSAVDGRDKWITLTAKGRTLFSIIHQSAYASKRAA